jgi:putative ABC transport system substrate-binding protein
VKRRTFLVAAGAMLAPHSVAAQQGGAIRTVGYLRPDPEPLRPDGRGVAIGELEDLGWKEGSNLRIERAFAAGREDQLPALAAELVRRQVDVILAIGPEAALAAARATSVIPIVFWGVGQPVEQELVNSLARPGRNATGMAWTAAMEVATKQLEMLKEIVPRVRRVVWIESPTAMQTVSGRQIEQSRLDVYEAGKRLALDLSEVTVHQPEDFAAAFARILESNAQAIAVRTTHLTWRERTRIAGFALSQRLPSAHGERDYVETGGLVSYGINWRRSVAPTVAYVDRILRGVRPADLPVELPSNYELVINMKTAKVLGIEIPKSVLFRADEVIQ